VGVLTDAPRPEATGSDGGCHPRSSGCAELVGVNPRLQPVRRAGLQDPRRLLRREDAGLLMAEEKAAVHLART